MAGLPGSSCTTWASQIFSNMVRAIAPSHTLSSRWLHYKLILAVVVVLADFQRPAIGSRDAGQTGLRELHVVGIDVVAHIQPSRLHRGQAGRPGAAEGVEDHLA